MTKEEIIDVIHKTMYQFFDVCGDNEEVPMSDKDELLLSVNKAICNNIKALEQPCEDAVSRKAIVEMLNAREQGSVMTFDHFIELIYKIPSVTPTQRWIPVSEKLPEDGQRVLVTQTFVERYVVYATRFPFEETKKKYIIAWMPLPKPYVPYTNAGKMEETLSYADQDTMQPAT